MTTIEIDYEKIAIIRNKIKDAFKKEEQEVLKLFLDKRNGK